MPQDRTLDQGCGKKKKMPLLPAKLNYESRASSTTCGKKKLSSVLSWEFFFRSD
jgi:hypothetical protein